MLSRFNQVAPYLVVFCIANSAAAFAETNKSVGGWQVKISQDEITDDSKVIVLKVSDSSAIGFRCFGKDASIMLLSTSNYRQGDTFDVVVRLDKEEPINTEGVALNSHGIELSNLDNDFYKHAKTAKTLAIRVKTTITADDYKFSMSNFDKVYPELDAKCKFSSAQ